MCQGMCMCLHSAEAVEEHWYGLVLKILFPFQGVVLVLGVVLQVLAVVRDAFLLEKAVGMQIDGTSQPQVKAKTTHSADMPLGFALGASALKVTSSTSALKPCT